MRTQQQAFRAYYASMTDSELLAVAQNRSSFIRAAQNPLADELERRNLTPPADSPARTQTDSNAVHQTAAKAPQ